MKKVLCILLCALMIFSTIQLSASAAPEEGDGTVTYRALVIGEANMKLQENCPGCDNDADLIEAALQKPGVPYTVTKIQNATKNQLESGIETAFAAADSDDVSLFYYSGHGSYSSNGDNLCLCLAPASGVWLENYSIKLLKQKLDNVPGKVVLILDCCGSGGSIIASKSRQESRDAYDAEQFNNGVVDIFATPKLLRAKGAVFAKDKYFVLTASDVNEKSWSVTIKNDNEGTNDYHSVFSLALAESMGYIKIHEQGLLTHFEITGNDTMPADTDADYRESLSEAYNYTEPASLYLSLQNEDKSIIQHTRVYPENSEQTIFDNTGNIVHSPTRSIAGAYIQVDDLEYKKSGRTINPALTLNGKTLRKGTDYVLLFFDKDYISVGRHVVRAYGIGEYSGSLPVYFNIYSYDLSNYSIKKEPFLGFFYDGKEKKPKIHLCGYNVSEYFLEEGVDYTLSYSNNIEVGTAYTTVTGIGKYTGRVSVSNSILDPSDSIVNYLSEISVGAGVKTAYFKGDSFDYDNLKVFAGYSNNNNTLFELADSQYIVTPPELSKAGKSEVGIEFKKGSSSIFTSYTVYVFDKEDLIPYKEPTCTESGMKAHYKYIDGDNEYYFDEILNTINDSDIVIPAHHTEAIDGAVAPTCTEAGKTEGIWCSVCGTVIKKQETVPALGHTEVMDGAEAPTCTEAGKTEGVHCSVCGTVIKKQEIVPATGHDWGEWINTKAATCETEGTETRTCKRDASHTQTQAVPANGHEYIAVVTPATCTEQGYTTHTCSRCGDSFKDSETAAIGHDYKSAVTAPTCTEAGFITHTCSRCGDSYRDGETAAHGHDMQSTTTKATLKKDGAVVTTCARCGESQTKTIAYPKAITLSKDAFTFNNKVQKPTVKVVGSDGKVISSKNYTVTYAKGCKAIGKYSVKIVFKGNYSGTKTLSFTIVPTGTALTKVTAGAKSFTAQWKQNKTGSGYQIQYSTNAKFTSSKKLTVKNSKTLKATLKKLSAKKVYYVRIRTYKTISKANYFSAWSKALKVKTK